MRIILFSYFNLQISNFWLGRYIWYQSRDFNDFWESLWNGLIMLKWACVVYFCCDIELKLFDSPTKYVANPGYGE